MYLYFKRTNGEYKLLASDIKNIEDKKIGKTIHEFLDEHNFKSYYTRTWQDENEDYVYDVGSHTEFFILSKNEY